MVGTWLLIDRGAERREGEKGRTGKGAQCLEWLVGLREGERAFWGDTAQRLRHQLSRKPAPAACSCQVASRLITTYIGVCLLATLRQSRDHTGDVG